VRKYLTYEGGYQRFDMDLVAVLFYLIILAASGYGVAVWLK
jgi:hypothetical protein